MTGKENIIRAIEFKNPEYLPIELGFAPEWMRERNEGKESRINELLGLLKHDILNPSSFVHAIGEVKKDKDRSSWVDEWGTGWEDDGFGTKAVSFPLEEGYEQLEGYAFPDSILGPHICYSDKLKSHDGTKYLRANVWFTLFERLWMLRGFENMLMDPYIERENFEHLRDRIVEFNLQRIDQWLEYKVDGIYFSDDWGTQRGLLINPEDWRKYYKPAYIKMFRRVRDAGAHVFMHLCGNIIDILPDLIEIGLNVLNPIQPQAMDINKVDAEFGGKVCFLGGVDVQGTLINAKPSEVKQEVFSLVKLLGRHNGGYIGTTSHTIMPETPLDNIIAMFEAFLEVQGG